MTLKKVKASDVIGSKYYTYQLSSSNYTPSLNGTITITCTVYNIYDETVSNKSVTLYQNGTSKGAKTTNTNGVCTWSITCSNGGLQKFNVNDTSIEVYVDNKSEIGHTHSQYLTEHQSLKTINSQSLIGTGNIDVSPTIDSDWVSNSTNPVQSKVIKTALDNKLDKTHTSYKGKNVVTNASTGTIEFEDKNNHTHSQYLTQHQSLKTINNETLVGTGNITIDIDEEIEYIELSVDEDVSEYAYVHTIELYGTSTKDIIDNTTTNAKFLFKMPSISDELGSSQIYIRLHYNNGNSYRTGVINKGNSVYMFDDAEKLSNAYVLVLLSEYANSFMFFDIISKSNYAEAEHIHHLDTLRFGNDFNNGWESISLFTQDNDYKTVDMGGAITLDYSNNEAKATYYRSLENYSKDYYEIATIDDIGYTIRGEISAVALSNDYEDLDNKPTIPTATSDLVNDSGFLTSHQSLTGYLQQSDVKDNLTSTDTNKPLSANQGKQLKALIDSKEDNIEIFTGSVDRVSSTSAFLKAYTTSSIIEGKIILYKVPNISSIEWATNVALDYYRNNQTSTFYRKYVYKNGVQLTFGDIESNSWLLLAYEGTVSNGQWNLISSSSYVETKNLPTVTSDLTGDYLQTQQGNEVFGVSNNAIDYGNQALTLNTSNNKFYYNKLEGSGEIATIYDLNKTFIKNFSNNETVINKQYDTSKEVKFHYSRTSTTDCDGYIQIGDDENCIKVGIILDNYSDATFISIRDEMSGDYWAYYLTNVDDNNSFDISLRLELDTQDIESLQLGDEFRYFLILTVDGIFEQIFSAERVITQADDVDIFLNRNYISKVIQDTNSRVTDLTFSTDDVYVEKADLNNNSTSLDSLFADMIDYGMDNDSEW